MCEKNSRTNVCPIGGIYMNIKFRHIIIVFITVLLNCIPVQSDAAISEPKNVYYKAIPPFTTNAVEPNILLVMDMSGSMQFPAYMGCVPLWQVGFDGTVAKCGTESSGYDYVNTDKYGYFKIDKYYVTATDNEPGGSKKFKVNNACPTLVKEDSNYRIGSSGCISGNLLNWATMSRIDLMRKVLIGGKSASTQGNAHTLRGEGGRRTYSDSTLDCTFELAGGDGCLY